MSIGDVIIEGTCPACGCNTQFVFVGRQEVPEVAQAVLGKELILVDCKECGTTRTTRNVAQSSTQV